jgi:hypothetical protein
LKTADGIGANPMGFSENTTWPSGKSFIPKSLLKYSSR